MKKRTLKSMVCAAVMALALSITACGSGDMTLEKYYNENKAVLDATWSSMSEEGTEVDVNVVENEFIMNIKITDSNLMVDGIGEALGDTIQLMADTYKAQAEEFDKVVGQEGACTVTIRYLDPDSNVLAENSFKAN